MFLDLSLYKTLNQSSSSKIKKLIVNYVKFLMKKDLKKNQIKEITKDFYKKYLKSDNNPINPNYESVFNE